MKKAEIRKKLDKLNIPYTEKDSVDILNKKLAQAKMLEKKEPNLPYVLMDSEDDQQILAELQGAVLDTYVYSFEQEGKTITGLSRAGVEQACRESANKRGEVYRIMDEPKVEEDAEYIKAIIKAGRYKILLDKKGNFKGEILLDTAIGAKRQWKKLRTRDGKIIDNRFAFEMAISKAQRNAKMSLLPYKFIAEMINIYRKQGKEKVIIAGKKIGSAQLQYLHGLSNEYGITHEKLTDIVKKEFGYESLNELQMEQVSRVVELIKQSKPKVIEMPVELIGLFNAKGVMKAKRDAMFLKALELSNNDPAEASKLLKEQLEKTE